MYFTKQYSHSRNSWAPSLTAKKGMHFSGLMIKESDHGSSSSSSSSWHTQMKLAKIGPCNTDTKE
jgi:hypothetical protein